MTESAISHLPEEELIEKTRSLDRLLINFKHTSECRGMEMIIDIRKLQMLDIPAISSSILMTMEGEIKCTGCNGGHKFKTTNYDNRPVPVLECGY